MLVPKNLPHGRSGYRLASALHVQPGVQTLERDTAIHLSREINNWLGGIIQEYPHTFRRFCNAADPIAHGCCR